MPIPRRGVSPGSTCRGGDYAGATPDAAASLGATTGKVWLSNQRSGASFDTDDVHWRTRNWAATP